MKIKIIYEDNHLIIIEKPSGILSQAGSLDLPDILSMTKDYLKEKYNKPGEVYLGLVHRLDTNVGGVMAFAKTSKAASRLSKEIRDHNFEKNYLSVVIGELEVGKTLELIDYLGKDNIKKQAVFESKELGKKAVLRFKVLACKNNLSLLKIELETGRFHQIRAQLSNLGYPIYNDSKYGSVNNGFDLGLYAYRISFIHPTLKTKLEFINLPSDNIFSLFTEEMKILLNKDSKKQNMEESFEWLI